MGRDRGEQGGSRLESVVVVGSAVGVMAVAVAFAVLRSSDAEWADSGRTVAVLLGFAAIFLGTLLFKVLGWKRRFDRQLREVDRRADRGA